jgi:hypothetical protein
MLDEHPVESLAGAKRIRGSRHRTRIRARGFVPRSVPNVRVESSVANKIDPCGQTWRKSRPISNRRLPIGQPRSEKAGYHQKGVARPISDRNLTFAYELETGWLAGCRHDQQQALLRWRDLKRIDVPFDCLQRSLGHGRICCVGWGFGPALFVRTRAALLDLFRPGRGPACRRRSIPRYRFLAGPISLPDEEE